MHTQLNSLDPRITRTRQALRQALIELIQLKGYRNITVKDITQRAGLNRSTFYLHFQNKDDLLLSGFEGLWVDLENSLPLGIMGEGKDPASLTKACLEGEFQRLEQIRPYYQALLGRSGAPFFKERLQDQVLDGLKELLARSHPALSDHMLDLDAALAALSAAYLGLLEWWLAGEAPCSPERMADLFLRFLCSRPCDMIGFDPQPGKGEGK